MRKINVLENTIINKIAAGEVVERPYSVIKELIENSLDANATTITVEIKSGGKSYIRVTDNGGGIDKSQVKLAFFRHATSKIVEIDDLTTLLTLGFRGEALSSISSVSKVEITTKTDKNVSGIKLIIHGNEILEEKEVGCVTGTSIIVRDLFYNVPVRLKFLKKASVETGHINDLIQAYALARPDVNFKYINNNNIQVNTTGRNDLKSIIFNIYGKEVSDSLVEIKGKNKEMVINGYIANPVIINRVTKRYSKFFLNKRYIKSDYMLDAVKESLQDRLMRNKYPVFVLNIEIEPSKVDVNVHPTKLEVRFEDELMVYDFILNTVEKAFKKENILGITHNNINKFKDFSNMHRTNPTTLKNIYPRSSNILNEPSKDSEINNSISIALNQLYEINEPREDFLLVEGFNNKNNHIQLNKKNHTTINTINSSNITSFDPIPIDKNTAIVDYKYIGQLFNTYSIIEKDKSFYLVDQHAAHEKVLYEKIIKSFHNREVISQQLIEPVTLNLDSTDGDILKENINIFKEFGFDIEDFGPNAYALRSVPILFNSALDVNFLIDLIDIVKLKKNKIQGISSLCLEKIALKACKSAIKANDRLEYLEVRELIRELINLDGPNTCPHGRPTMIEITKYEIEKMFKRIQ